MLTTPLQELYLLLISLTIVLLDRRDLPLLLVGSDDVRGRWPGDRPPRVTGFPAFGAR